MPRGKWKYFIETDPVEKHIIIFYNSKEELEEWFKNFQISYTKCTNDTFDIPIWTENESMLFKLRFGA